MSEISEFYKGKSVFLTGVTGFVGKALLEKLLRSCPGVHAIYCLVRPKKSKSPEDRLQETLNDAAFDTIRDRGLIARVQAIEGDVASVGLGLSKADRTLLKDSVNVVLHCAATIRFDESLRVAAECNLRGVRDLVRLSREMQHLESFVYVSTAYANIEQTRIEEKIYPYAFSPQKLLEMIETLDDDTLQQVTPELLGEKPNTYILTKHLAEIFLKTEASDLPVSIVRPPIVIASWKEPLPGWLAGWSGFGVVFVGILMGIIQVAPDDEDHKLDFMPVDLVVNLVLAASWHDKISKEGLGSKVYPTVYHLSSGAGGPNSWIAIRSYLKTHVEEYPYRQSIRSPTAVGTTNRVRYYCIALIDHWLFACVIDGLLLCFRQKPRFLSIYKKLHTRQQTMTYFLARDWIWNTRHSDAMRSNMSRVDQKLFYFDPAEISWDTYWINYYEGARRFQLKEDCSEIKKTRTKIRVVNTVQLTVKVLAICAICGVAEKKFGIGRLTFSWFRSF